MCSSKSDKDMCVTHKLSVIFGEYLLAWCSRAQSIQKALSIHFFAGEIDFPAAVSSGKGQE